MGSFGSVDSEKVDDDDNTKSRDKQLIVLSPGIGSGQANVITYKTYRDLIVDTYKRAILESKTMSANPGQQHQQQQQQQQQSKDIARNLLVVPIRENRTYKKSLTLSLLVTSKANPRARGEYVCDFKLDTSAFEGLLDPTEDPTCPKFGLVIKKIMTISKNNPIDHGVTLKIHLKSRRFDGLSPPSDYGNTIVGSATRSAPRHKQQQQQQQSLRSQNPSSLIKPVAKKSEEAGTTTTTTTNAASDSSNGIAHVGGMAGAFLDSVLDAVDNMTTDGDTPDSASVETPVPKTKTTTSTTTTTTGRSRTALERNSADANDIELVLEFPRKCNTDYRSEKVPLYKHRLYDCLPYIANFDERQLRPIDSVQVMSAQTTTVQTPTTVPLSSSSPPSQQHPSPGNIVTNQWEYHDVHSPMFKMAHSLAACGSKKLSMYGEDVLAASEKSSVQESFDMKDIRIWDLGKKAIGGGGGGGGSATNVTSDKKKKVDSIDKNGGNAGKYIAEIRTVLCERVRSIIRRYNCDIYYTDVVSEKITPQVSLTDTFSIPNGSSRSISFCLDVEYMLIPFSHDDGDDDAGDRGENLSRV